ncbi:MAG: response regulator, partial [Phycisphaerales bacterium]
MFRALVLDDEQDYRKLLAHTLERMGLQVNVAATTAEAAKFLSRDQANMDLLVADIRLQGPQDGLAFAREARLSHRDLGLIIITGYGSPDSLRRSTELGALAYLEKPFPLRTLKDFVQRYLDHRKLAHEVHRLEQQLAAAQAQSWTAQALAGWPMACVSGAGEVLFATPEGEAVLEEVSPAEAEHPISQLEPTLAWQLGESLAAGREHGQLVVYRRDGVIGHYTALVRALRGNPRNGATILFVEGDLQPLSRINELWMS